MLLFGEDGFKDGGGPGGTRPPGGALDGGGEPELSVDKKP